MRPIWPIGKADGAAGWRARVRSEEQQRRLLAIANKCSVHRALVSRAQIATRLESNHV